MKVDEYGELNESCIGTHVEDDSIRILFKLFVESFQVDLSAISTEKILDLQTSFLGGMVALRTWVEERSKVSCVKHYLASVEKFFKLLDEAVEKNSNNQLL